MALMRSFRPHVVTTYDEQGGYPHPDHIMCHEVTMAAFDAAGDPGRYSELGEPWQPQKVYYHQGFHKERFDVLHRGCSMPGMESPFGEWLDEWVDRPEDQDRVTTKVPCGEYFPVRDEALRAHATQIDDDGWWFAVPDRGPAAVVADRGLRAGRSLVDIADCLRTTCSPGFADRGAQWCSCRLSQRLALGVPNCRSRPRRARSGQG